MSVFSTTTGEGILTRNATLNVCNSLMLGQRVDVLMRLNEALKDEYAGMGHLRNLVEANWDKFSKEPISADAIDAKANQIKEYLQDVTNFCEKLAICPSEATSDMFV